MSELKCVAGYCVFIALVLAFLTGATRGDYDAIDLTIHGRTEDDCARGPIHEGPCLKLSPQGYREPEVSCRALDRCGENSLHVDNR